MARPREEIEQTPPFVLDQATLQSLLDEGRPRLFSTSTTNLIGSVPASEVIPEWYDDFKGQVLQAKDVKNSPGFDPGPEQARQVEQMSALGASSTEIANILRIEPKLLKKYYRYELESATSRINQKVAQVALQSALGGDTDMVKFWLKTRAGWKETKVTELTGAGGGPVEFREVKQRMLDAIEAEIVDIEFED